MRLGILCVALCPTLLMAQTGVPSDTPAPPSSSAAPSSTAQAQTPEREVSWTKLPRNLLADQRSIWLSPAKLKEGKYWIPTVAILGTTAGLIALDPKPAHYFRNTSTFEGFNNAFSGTNTSLAIFAAPVAMYGIGLIRKDSKMQSTALFAGEAVLDSEIVATVFKDISRRTRPADIAPDGNFSHTWFQGDWKPLSGNSSFPSGHTIAAFSVATVIARRYGNHKWVPYVAYGSAALIGFSRMTLSAHFASDVFVGAALGYSISRFAVLRQ
jgi:membrane-associated phospholipid phosphatase